MRFWLVKFTGLVVSLAFFLTLLTPISIALAQAGDCTDPDYYRENIQGCSGFTPQSILQAVQAPTPNLANTTAYVFYTLLVLLTGSMDPGSLNVASAQPGDNYYADQRLDRPDSLGEALGNGGAVGGVAYAMSELITTRPASLGDYTYYLAKNSRFTPQPAYAQGFGVGFGALYPILPIWAAFRDIAYFLLTLMFFITGLLIIFRKKVSGNVAVTVQNALPRLVLTLIFITFSYPIAGFIVDLMFWAIYFIIFIFAGMFTEFPFTTTLPSSLFEERNIFSLFADTSLFKIAFVFIMGSGAEAAAEAMREVIFDAISSVPVLGDIAGIGFVESIIGGVMELIFTLVIGVAILIQIFRTFFQLLMSYAGFIINVVLSPFVLLQGAIPGKDPLVNWLKNLVAGLAPFVVVVFMLMMSFILVGINTRPGIGYGSDQGDMETGSGLRLPLIGGQDISQQAIMGLLGLGFIMLLPEAVKMTKDLIGVKGGPLDQYKDKAFSNVMEGWKGNKYVPGAKKILPFAASTAATTGTGMVTGAYSRGRRQYDRAQMKYADKQPIVQKLRTGIDVLSGGVTGGLAGGALGAPIPAGKAIAQQPLVRKTTESILDISKLAASARISYGKQAGEEKFAELTDATNQDSSGGPKGGKKGFGKK